MKLISYRRGDDTETVGILRDDIGGPYDLIRAIRMFAVSRGECVPPIFDMIDLLDAGIVDPEVLKEVEDFIEKHDLLDVLSDADDFTVLSPLARPRAIYALGRNYAGHAREMGAPVTQEPIIFAKAPSSVIGPNEEVIYKPWLTRVDPEAELAVVIGRRGRDIPTEDAAYYIAGYTIVNDVTARDIQTDDLANARPWFRSKSLDTFCPTGPNITLTDEISHPVELEVKMRVNGEVRQCDNTRSLIFDIPFLISWISRYCTLQPGDVISTGTPEGIRPVAPGDIMEASVERVGVLRNPVVSE